jgi:hypothetical protein
MGRRLLSHLLITLAVFSLTATFFIWVIDATILNPSRLTQALQEGGVPSAIASVIPEKASQDSENKDDVADMKTKIAAVVTPDYVHQKMSALAVTMSDFIKKGNPQPVIDVSDFPTKLRASGVEVGDDIDKNFADPIQLNKDGALDTLPQAYKTFKLVKIAGVVLFLLLLLAEWFVAAKGDKLHRIGRIFLHAAIWYTIYWLALVFVPARALPALKEKAGVTGAENTLIDAFVKSIQHLFGVYLLGFAIVCGVLALVLYLARHGRKHVQAIQAVPEAKGKPKSVPNKR